VRRTVYECSNPIKTGGKMGHFEIGTFKDMNSELSQTLKKNALVYTVDQNN
jgi:hypothetical protein